MKKNTLLFLLFQVLVSVNGYSQMQFEMTKKQGEIGILAGIGGFIRIDTDDDGIDEIVSSAFIPGTSTGTYWYAFNLNSKTGLIDVIPEYISDPFSETIVNIKKAEAVIGPGFIVLGTTKSLGQDSIFVYDPFTKLRVAALGNNHQYVCWNITDFNGDESDDIMVFSQNNVDIFSIPDLSLIASLPIENGYGYKSFSENQDEDPEDEIVMYGYGIVQFFDFQSGVYKEIFKRSVQVNEVVFTEANNDSNKEVALLYNGNSQFDSIIVFDWESLQVVYQKRVAEDHPNLDFGNFYNMGVGDVTGDGKEELVYGSQQYVFVTNAATGNTLDVMENVSCNYGNLSDIFVSDFNGDNISEILWADGHFLSTNVGSHIHIRRFNQPQSDWVSPVLAPYNYSYRALHLTDINQDGNLEIVNFVDRQQQELVEFADSTFLYRVVDAGTVSVFNPLNWSLKYASSFDVGILRLTPFDYRTINIDSDPQQEIISIIGNVLMEMDGLSFVDTIRYIDQPSGCSSLFRGIELDDLESDGSVEICVLAETYSVSNSGCTRLIVFDNEFNIKWESDVLANQATYADVVQSKVGNIDDDPQSEVIIRTSDQLEIIDGLTREHTLYSGFQEPTFALYDFDQDGLDNIILGGLGEIRILNKQMAVAYTIPLPEPGIITNLRVFDFDEDGLPEFIISQNGYIMVVNPYTYMVEWVSKDMNVNFPVHLMEVGKIGNTKKIWTYTDYYFAEFTYEGTTKANDAFQQQTSDIFITNPASKNNQFTIFNPGNLEISSVEIFDCIGNFIHLFEEKNDSSTEIISQLSAGVYWARISLGGNKILAKKIIKID